ncbi:hypothetical protein TrVE_jg11118 [Triparma verrucosa]|uniref:LITAF domain-containing protein n=1 Tax=Triparma verrucosa TaxID=1606542 RepID=A0A9W7DNU3_9STRA|nr:hypothetical protein TrVE_jg11118 [Triparma verrucosa]
MSNPNDSDIEKGNAVGGKNAALIKQHTGPCKLHCPSCNKGVKSDIDETEVDYEWYQIYLLCLLLPARLCCRCFCRKWFQTNPMCWPIKKDTEHICSECGESLGVKESNLDFLRRE